jgi:RNA polymerase sigma-70 factor (ECF subfamily)
VFGKREPRSGGGDADLDRWLDAARSGDRTAFGWIWQSLAGRVNGYLRGKGVESPDDVTSEVFLAAFQGLESFEGDGARFRSWLFTIAHHKAVDDLRRRRVQDEYDPETDARTAPSAESDALDGILDADVRAALETLTDEQREVLLLRTLGDLSLEQVAEATGRTVGAVKQLHHRAVAAAQRALADREYTRPGAGTSSADRRPGGSAARRPVAAAVVPAHAVTSAASRAMTET